MKCEKCKASYNHSYLGNEGASYTDKKDICERETKNKLRYLNLLLQKQQLTKVVNQKGLEIINGGNVSTSII